MYYPNVNNNNNSRSMIDTWLGYNHNFKIANGEFFDTENITSDLFPIMSARKIRPRLAMGNLRGIICTDNRLTYLEGKTLHYGLREIELDDLLPPGNEWQMLYRFGAYILMYPANIYVNLFNDSDRGTMASKYVVPEGITITYTMCDAEGNNFDNITAGLTPPTNPTKDSYWAKTVPGEEGLYIWTGDSWNPVATSYIRIDIPGANLTDYFSEYDTVFMNTFMPDINNGSQIEKLTDESAVVIGFMKHVQETAHTSASWQLTIERKMPRLDYVFVDKNRVWGCYYGWDDTEHKMINEIYCTKLGDFKNWYTYQGLADDSYAVTVGMPEEWTGCISYQGYPTFFKENAIFRVFGSVPSSFQVNQINARGVQLGSSKSLAIVDEKLVYKSAVDVCVFDGSVPVSISQNLGRDEKYYDGVAGSCLGKYKLEVTTNLGGVRSFVYDMKTNTWQKEDALGIVQYTNTNNGQLYAATDTDIYGMGDTDNMAYTEKLVGEEWVEWFAETGDMGYETPDYKYVSRITLRAYVPNRSEIKVSISYNDMPFNQIGMIRGDTTVASQSLAINPLRCDHYRLRFEGHGDFKIYSLAITLDTESEENGYKN